METTIERLPGTKSKQSTINRVYADLLKGRTLTTLQGLRDNKTMYQPKFISLLRLRHKVPVKDRWVELTNGKRVKEYWLDQSYRQRILNNN